MLNSRPASLVKVISPPSVFITTTSVEPVIHGAARPRPARADVNRRVIVMIASSVNNFSSVRRLPPLRGSIRYAAGC